MRRLAHLVVLVIVCTAGVVWLIRPIVAQGTSCAVATTNGDVQGLIRSASCAFLGVPFAAPPVASLRWKAPQPTASWPLVSPRHDCAPHVRTTQRRHRAAVGQRGLSQAECVDAEPFALGGAGDRLVHPGSFSSASANFAPQNGEALAAATGAIVVAHQLSARPVRISRPSGADNRRQGRGQLRLSRPACGADVGPRPHCGVWGRPRQRDTRRPVSRRSERRAFILYRPEVRVFPSRHHAEWLPFDSVAKSCRCTAARRAVRGDTRLRPDRSNATARVPAVQDARSGSVGATAECL